MNLKLLAIAGFSAIATTLPCSADEPSAISAFAKQVVVPCMTTMTRMIDHPLIQNSIKSNILSVISVCSCAETKISEDPKILKYLTGDAITLKRRKQDREFINYFQARFVVATFSCMVEEIDASIASVQLPQ